MKLNLGCSNQLLSGYQNVDICLPADKIADLSKYWPWDDNSVDEIRAYDIIEHLPNKIHTVNEAWRVLKPGGIFDIIVPTTDGRGAFQDPQHISFWNLNSFQYYCKGVAEYERFHVAYGIKCCYSIISKEESVWPIKVTKLHIALRAEK